MTGSPMAAASSAAIPKLSKLFFRGWLGQI